LHALLISVDKRTKFGAVGAGAKYISLFFLVYLRIRIWWKARRWS
jgi:hypothetical protein